MRDRRFIQFVDFSISRALSRANILRFTAPFPFLSVSCTVRISSLISPPFPPYRIVSGCLLSFILGPSDDVIGRRFACGVPRVPTMVFWPIDGMPCRGNASMGIF